MYLIFTFKMWNDPLVMIFPFLSNHTLAVVSYMPENIYYVAKFTLEQLPS